MNGGAAVDTSSAWGEGTATDAEGAMGEEARATGAPAGAAAGPLMGRVRLGEVDRDRIAVVAPYVAAAGDGVNGAADDVLTGHAGAGGA